MKTYEDKKGRSAFGWIWWFIVGITHIPRWFIGGGLRKWWDEFGSYIVGWWKLDKESGTVLWIKFIHYPDMIHYHPMIWGGLVLAAIESRFLPTKVVVVEGVKFWHVPEAWITIGIIYWVVSLYALIAYFKDLPFWSVIRKLFWIGVIVLADFGLSVLAARIESEWLQRGVLRPLGSFIFGLAPFSSPGMYLLMSITWGIILLWTILPAWMRNRKRLSDDELFTLGFMESEGKVPVYMRECRRLTSDMFEWLFRFADMVLTTRDGVKTYRNVFGLAGWLRKPFMGLIDSAQRKEEKRKASAERRHEDAADMVRSEDADQDEVEGDESDGVDAAEDVHEYDGHDDVNGHDV